MLTTQSTGPAIAHGSVMSCSTNWKRQWDLMWAILSGLPVRKLSRPTTVWPSARRRSHICDPMKPAAPETTMRKFPPRLLYRSPGSERVKNRNNPGKRSHATFKTESTRCSGPDRGIHEKEHSPDARESYAGTPGERRDGVRLRATGLPLF